MKKAKKSRTAWLSVAIITLVVTLVSIPLCAITALKESYALMAVFAVIIIHGCYGIGFYSLEFSRANATVKCLLAVDEGRVRYSDISTGTGYNESAVRSSLLRAVKKGFITASLGDERVEI